MLAREGEKRMGKTVTAVFDGQALHPEGPVDLKPNARYRVTIEREVREGEAHDAWDILQDLTGALHEAPNWAAEHDHYLYGTPARKEEAA
jgi:hypothetical protein